MAGIAGLTKAQEWDTVNRMLESISHRGGDGHVVMEHGCVTAGEIHSQGVSMWLGRKGDCRAVCDGVIYNWRELAPECLDVDHAIQTLYDEQGPDFVKRLEGAFAIAIALDSGVFLARDGLGIAPLYWGASGNHVVFASEVKALVGQTEGIQEFPPGYYSSPTTGLVNFFELGGSGACPLDPAAAAKGLRRRLAEAVQKCLAVSSDPGCWLSGGLDSSILAALLRLHTPEVHTFSVGIGDSSDLECARTVAGHIGSRHHEISLTPPDLMHAVADVIYHLESFDALLVRSSLTNYIVGKAASECVNSVLSGEGGDELFAGYDYLKKVSASDLPEELLDITGRLHNTALQRVDRCSRAHGLTAHTPFLDREVLDYALSLPVEYKMYRKGEAVSKWVLRQAASGLLPSEIAQRPKAKFWEGAGVVDIIAAKADQTISDEDLSREKTLADGQELASKEELLYFRAFTEHFGRFEDYSFVGRTKQPPQA